MASKRWWMALGLLGLLLPQEGHATNYLTWECTMQEDADDTAVPATKGKAPAAVPCARGLDAPQWGLAQMQVLRGKITQQVVPLTPLAPGACQQFPKTAWESGKYRPDLSWCAELGCPKPGAYSVILQANEYRWSNAVMFGINGKCEVIDYDEALAKHLPPEDLPTSADVPTDPPLDPEQPILPEVPEVPETPPDADAIAPGATPTGLAELTLPPTTAPTAALRARLEQIAQEYQRAQETIRQRYRARLAAVVGKAVERLRRQWAAYHEESHQLQQAYLGACRAWDQAMQAGGQPQR